MSFSATWDSGCQFLRRLIYEYELVRFKRLGEAMNVCDGGGDNNVQRREGTNIRPTSDRKQRSSGRRREERRLHNLLKDQDQNPGSSPRRERGLKADTEKYISPAWVHTQTTSMLPSNPVLRTERTKRDSNRGDPSEVSIGKVVRGCVACWCPSLGGGQVKGGWTPEWTPPRLACARASNSGVGRPELRGVQGSKDPGAAWRLRLMSVFVWMMN